MQKYHDRLHGLTEPKPEASQLQSQSWHDLAGRYSLQDMMNVSRASPQLGQGVEEQFESYGNGQLSPLGTDLVEFWVVSRISR
jgi:hypothetical protein